MKPELARSLAAIMLARLQDRDESTRYAVAATLAWIALCDRCGKDIRE